MSSEHAVIIARHDITGRLEFPLGDTTLYDTSDYGLDDEQGGVGSVSSIMRQCQKQYGDDWTLTLYVSHGASYSGQIRTLK